VISPERVATLCNQLRESGLGCSLSESTTALEVCAHIDCSEAEDVRLGLRSAFCSAHEELETFERCFWPWWREELQEGPQAIPPAQSATPRSPDSASVGASSREASALEASSLEASSLEASEELSLGPAEASEEDAHEEPGDIGAAYSRADQLARRSFRSVDEDELRAIDSWIDRLMITLAVRRSRRLEVGGRRGVIDVRRTLRSAVGHDGELIRLVRKRRRLDRPRLVVLCDVSGSMERYSRFLLRFLLGCGRTQDIQTFAFSTRLTHLTPWLAATAIDPALAQLRARGWSSGTRIGECLETFVRRYGGRMLGQRTIVLILSDGLDQGEVEPLERAMLRLQRRSRKILWLNPLLESSRYAPEARGMRAALPFVDHFHSGHSLEALRDLPRILQL